MKLNLQRPICILDIESTSVNVSEARIVELGIRRQVPGQDEPKKRWVQRFNPGVPIPAEATEVHGIADADVADEPFFADMARVIHHGLLGVDICGFNLMNYDIPVLWEEFYRAGIEWDLTGTNIVDVCQIFKKREERTLAAAVQFFLGRDHEGAHGALPDVDATWDVLVNGMLPRYADLQGKTVADLAKESKYEGEERIDLVGKLIRDKDGDAVYNFGKVKGKKVRDDIGFANWMLGKDFPANTLVHLHHELGRIKRPQVPDLAKVS